MGEKVLRSLMRTTDVFVAASISPAAAAAVGIGDSFNRIVNRVGNSLGDATIALSSQDTGVEALGNRDEAISQSLMMSFALGFVFVVFGLLFSFTAIELMGAETAVIRLGGQYLTIIMIIAPLYQVNRVAVRAIQGTGDTQTPMYIRGGTNILNIVGTVVLAYGLGPFPQLSVVGIGLATALGEGVTTLLFLALIYGPWTDLNLVRPSDLIVTKQLVTVSVPKAAEGGVIAIAEIPFNSLLLSFGTEVNAAYHIANRIYRQLLNPARSGLSVAANILVGQSLGTDAEQAYFNGLATIGLSVLIIGVLSGILYGGAGIIVGIFTRSPVTAPPAIRFTQAFAIAGVFHAVAGGFKGALRGGSETRSPFVALLFGTFVFLLGVSYVGGIYLGLGVIAISLGIVLDFIWRAGFLGIVYYRRNWIDFGTNLMEGRDSIDKRAVGKE